MKKCFVFSFIFITLRDNLYLKSLALT
jgi:hypothetical protein